MLKNINLENSVRGLNDDIKAGERTLSGLLGIALGGQRLVEVSSRNGFVYVRLRDNTSEVIQAFNDAISPVYDLPVLVVRDGNRYKIQGRDNQRYDNWGSYTSYLPRHGNQHSFSTDADGGGDPVWVYPRQIMPMNVIPSGTLGSNNVLVANQILRDSDGDWIYVGDTGTPNLLTYAPTDNQGVMLLIYTEADSGNPGFLVGSGSYFDGTFTGTNDIVSHIPTTLDTSLIPLSAVRLVSGTSSIGWDNIYDVRQFANAIPLVPAWDDLRVPLSSIKRLGFSDPDWVQFADNGTGSVGVYALAFASNVDEEVYFTVQMPHGWKLGTDLEPHVHWSPSTADAGDVTFKLEYTISNIGGTFGNTTTLAVTDAADGVAKKHQLADLGTIDMSSYTDNGDVSIILACRLYRDVSDGDDYGADAFIHEIDFHYQADAVGSRQETSK